MTEKNGALALAVDYTPAEISADYEGMKARLAEFMEPYRDMDDEALARLELKELRDARADVNELIRNVEEGRKAVKRDYMREYDAFEANIKALLAPAREAEAQLKECVERKAGAERELRLRGLRETYEDFAPALALPLAGNDEPLVPFERVMQINPKWANKTYGAAKAAGELQEAVAKVARDWESLKLEAEGQPFFAEAEAEFFRTLDLSRALDMRKARMKEQARIDAMRAEREAYAAEQAARAEPVAEAHEPETVPEPQPEPVPRPEPMLTTVPGPEARPDEQRRAYTVRAVMTESQLAALCDWLAAHGVHGDVYEG